MTLRSNSTFAQFRAIRFRPIDTDGEWMVSNEELALLQEAREILSDNELNAKQRDLLPNDELICECLCVSAGDIRDFFGEKNVDISQLKLRFKMGTGCSSCLKSKDDWISKI